MNMGENFLNKIRAPRGEKKIFLNRAKQKWFILEIYGQVNTRKYINTYSPHKQIREKKKKIIKYISQKKNCDKFHHSFIKKKKKTF